MQRQHMGFVPCTRIAHVVAEQEAERHAAAVTAELTPELLSLHELTQGSTEALLAMFMALAARSSAGENAIEIEALRSFLGFPPTDQRIPVASLVDVFRATIDAHDSVEKIQPFLREYAALLKASKQ